MIRSRIMELTIIISLPKRTHETRERRDTLSLLIDSSSSFCSPSKLQLSRVIPLSRSVPTYYSSRGSTLIFKVSQTRRHTIPRQEHIKSSKTSLTLSLQTTLLMWSLEWHKMWLQLTIATKATTQSRMLTRQESPYFIKSKENNRVIYLVPKRLQTNICIITLHRSCKALGFSHNRIKQ